MMFLPVAGCTNRQEPDKMKSEQTLNAMIDNWHRAAAESDADTYFGMMAPGSVFIGTDKSENWTKGEFEAKYRPYFEKGKSWVFKPLERNWYFSRQGDVAWFDELLDTWMGVCRASGVLERSADGDWKIRHYQLSVTIDNDKIKYFIEHSKQ